MIRCVQCSSVRDMTDRIIHTDDDVAEGASWLADKCPRLAVALKETTPLPLRRRDGGFPALLQAICGQQLSVASAGAVWSKLDACGATELNGFSKVDDDGLRACGLSWPKIRYARALAEADPMHREGARTFTLRAWLVNEGSLTLTVGLSGHRAALS